jgi:hypothetical protein
VISTEDVGYDNSLDERAEWRLGALETVTAHARASNPFMPSGWARIGALGVEKVAGPCAAWLVTRLCLAGRHGGKTFLRRM